MKVIQLFLCFFSFTIAATCQERVPRDSNKRPYVVVDTFTVDLKYLVLNPSSIEKVNILKESNAVAAYGEKARYGALIFKTRVNTSLLRISDIAERYNLPLSDRQLRACINNIIVGKRELALLEESEIALVEITTDAFWIDPADANTGERFINITTKKND